MSRVPKFIVFGGSGQVGRALQRVLAPIGEVSVVNRHAVDLEQPDAIANVIDVVQPDAIINAAAYTAVDRAEDEPVRAFAVNARATEKLGQAAAKRGIWMVYYSTDYVFDGRKPSSYVESDDTGPLNVYGQSKLQGEESLAASGARHLILRTSWVYSAHGSNFVKTILRLAGERLDLRVVADQVGSPTSAELIADITAHLLSLVVTEVNAPASLSGIYHLTPGGETSWHGLAQFILTEAKALGFAAPLALERIVAIRSDEFPTKAHRPLNSRLATQKLRGTFDLDLPDWRGGVADVVRQLIAQGGGYGS